MQKRPDRAVYTFTCPKPEYTYEQVAGLAARVAKMVADADPKNATVERSKSKRKKDQIYVDHMQNSYGKSVVAPYSVRPKPGAPVSAPLEWAEVKRKKIRISDFTIETIVKRIEKKGDLFAQVLKNKQGLEYAFEKAKLNGGKHK